MSLVAPGHTLALSLQRLTSRDAAPKRWWRCMPGPGSWALSRSYADPKPGAAPDLARAMLPPKKVVEVHAGMRKRAEAEAAAAKKNKIDLEVPSVKP